MVRRPCESWCYIFMMYACTTAYIFYLLAIAYLILICTTTRICTACQDDILNTAIIIYAVYDGVGTSLYGKAVLTEQCMRWRTLKLTGYFCSALDMFTIMIGAWAIP